MQCEWATDVHRVSGWNCLVGNDSFMASVLGAPGALIHLSCILSFQPWGYFSGLASVFFKMSLEMNQRGEDKSSMELGEEMRGSLLRDQCDDATKGKVMAFCLSIWSSSLLVLLPWPRAYLGLGRLNLALCTPLEHQEPVAGVPWHRPWVIISELNVSCPLTFDKGLYSSLSN